MMIRMFDRDGNGIINFDEFVSLWRYLAAWRELFDRFDEDRSGRISLQEFENALVAFGYRLSPKFVSVLFSIFESKTRQLSGAPKSPHRSGMSFDLFVQACISLKRMTDVFKRYDDDRDGYITVSFEEFLTGEYLSFPRDNPCPCVSICVLSLLGTLCLSGWLLTLFYRNSSTARVISAVCSSCIHLFSRLSFHHFDQVSCSLISLYPLVSSSLSPVCVSVIEFSDRPLHLMGRYLVMRT